MCSKQKRTEAAQGQTGQLPGRRELRIAQVNLKQSRTRFSCLEQHIKSTNSNWHVIAVQDFDPESMVWLQPSLSSMYHVWYLEDGVITEDDHLMHRTTANPRRITTKSCVGFLVSRRIPISDWRVTAPEWGHDMVASLRLDTEDGPLTIHNVYNKNQGAVKLCIDTLTRWCCGDHDVLLGDFNLHHQTWSGSSIEPLKVTKDAKILHARTEESGMLSCVKPGAVIFKRSEKSDSCESTLDLVFVGKAWAELRPQWSVLNVKGFESDHRVCETRIDTTPRLDTRLLWRWHKADIGNLRRDFTSAAETLDDKCLDSTREVDDFLSTLVRALEEAVHKWVPRQKSSEFNVQRKHKQPRKAPQKGGVPRQKFFQVQKERIYNDASE